jgi:TRIAD3 protein (E3 ubiquitin-protein ligase RNF216)
MVFKLHGLCSTAGNVVVCFYCGKETCRLCNEASHVPLRCAEVEKKGETATRLSVEEAMTQARLRCRLCT